jgi:hypothetical protein
MGLRGDDEGSEGETGEYFGGRGHDDEGGGGTPGDQSSHPRGSAPVSAVEVLAHSGEAARELGANRGGRNVELLRELGRRSVLDVAPQDEVSLERVELGEGVVEGAEQLRAFDVGLGVEVRVAGSACASFPGGASMGCPGPHRAAAAKHGAPPAGVSVSMTRAGRKPSVVRHLD